MKCNQSGPGFELVSPCPFPTTITITPRTKIPKISKKKTHNTNTNTTNTAIRNDTDNTMENRMTITRKQKWEGKQLYGRFTRLINNVSHDKTWTLRKGNFKGETESLLIAAQNNAVRINHIKARIDKTQQNSKCRLCGDKDEAINHIISEYRKLVQKEYKTRHD